MMNLMGPLYFHKGVYQGAQLPYCPLLPWSQKSQGKHCKNIFSTLNQAGHRTHQIEMFIFIKNENQQDNLQRTGLQNIQETQSKDRS